MCIRDSFWHEISGFAKTAVSEIGKAIGAVSPAYVGCGGIAAVDGPLPIGDILGLAGATLLTVGSVGYGIYQAVKAPSISISKVQEKTGDKVDQRINNPVIFPINPNNFSPVGLFKVPRTGTDVYKRQSL